MIFRQYVLSSSLKKDVFQLKDIEKIAPKTKGICE